MNTGYVPVDDADEIAAIQTYALHVPIGHKDAAGQWWATPHSLAAYREWKSSTRADADTLGAEASNEASESASAGPEAQ